MVVVLSMRLERCWMLVINDFGMAVSQRGKEI